MDWSTWVFDMLGSVVVARERVAVLDRLEGGRFGDGGFVRGLV